MPKNWGGGLRTSTSYPQLIHERDRRGKRRLANGGVCRSKWGKPSKSLAKREELLPASYGRSALLSLKHLQWSWPHSVLKIRLTRRHGVLQVG